MYATDRKTINAMGNVQGFKSFDQDTVTGYLVQVGQNSDRAEYAQGFYLLKMGLVVEDVAKGGFKGAAAGYRKIAEGLNAEAASALGLESSTVWESNPTAITRNVSVVAHLAGGADAVRQMSPDQIWELVADFASAHGKVSSYYNANLAKDKGEKKARGPKSARELFATAARQAESEGLTRDEAVAYAMDAIATVFGGE
jgi:hypothetical protein